MFKLIKFLTNKLLMSIKFSLEGLNFAIKTDVSFRLELLLTLIIFPTAFLVGNSKIELALLIISWFLVIIVELINCAIESTIDRFENDINIFFKHAKDLGSAAVFLAIINCIVIWVIILF